MHERLPGKSLGKTSLKLKGWEEAGLPDKIVILLYKYDESAPNENVDVDARTLGKDPVAGNIFLVTL